MLVAVLQEPRTAFGQAQGTGEHGVVAGIAEAALQPVFNDSA